MIKMNEHDARRQELAKRVFHQIATTRRELEVVDADGVRPIVVALGDELLSDVMTRVAVSGGAANLFVEVERESGSEIALLLVRFGARNADAEDLGEEPISKDIEVGLMVDIVATAPLGVACRVSLRHVDAGVEYVDREQFVDA